jgi:hypothetical protein
MDTAQDCNIALLSVEYCPNAVKVYVHFHIFIQNWWWVELRLKIVPLKRWDENSSTADSSTDKMQLGFISLTIIQAFYQNLCLFL